MNGDEVQPARLLPPRSLPLTVQAVTSPTLILRNRVLQFLDRQAAIRVHDPDYLMPYQ